MCCPLGLLIQPRVWIHLSYVDVDGKESFNGIRLSRLRATKQACASHHLQRHVLGWHWSCNFLQVQGCLSHHAEEIAGSGLWPRSIRPGSLHLHPAVTRWKGILHVDHMLDQSCVALHLHRVRWLKLIRCALVVRVLRLWQEPLHPLGLAVEGFRGHQVRPCLRLKMIAAQWKAMADSGWHGNSYSVKCVQGLPTQVLRRDPTDPRPAVSPPTSTDSAARPGLKVPSAPKCVQVALSSIETWNQAKHTEKMLGRSNKKPASWRNRSPPMILLYLPEKDRMTLCLS